MKIINQQKDLFSGLTQFADNRAQAFQWFAADFRRILQGLTKAVMAFLKSPEGNHNRTDIFRRTLPNIFQQARLSNAFRPVNINGIAALQRLDHHFGKDRTQKRIFCHEESPFSMQD